MAEREGFIPLPKVHELQRFSNIPEYPYLRKYPSIKRAFSARPDDFLACDRRSCRTSTDANLAVPQASIGSRKTFWPCESAKAVRRWVRNARKALISRRFGSPSADAVNRLLAEPRLAARIGQSARQLAVERYAWEGAARALEDFYRTILETRS